ncbi:MAG: efflux transporter outer membrane subunit [Gallionellaceae bacterium]|nr:efflux transporter outer membrane subunit [Gallionellaceae bacterium]
MPFSVRPMPHLKVNSGLVASLLACLLSACTPGQDFVRPQLPETAWHAPLPHGGKVENLSHWWERMDDALLTQLITQAEKNNPTLDQALARLAEARANLDGSRAAGSPALGANAGITRSKSVFGQQIFSQTVGKLGFDAGWELDLFGRNRRGREAAQARLGAGEAGWHDARISLAAEVADSYVGLRACEGSLELMGKLLVSRRVTSGLVGLRKDSGFASASDWARDQAAQAESAAGVEAKKSECARLVNQLVALTGMPHETLQDSLAARRGMVPVPAEIALDQVAANALSQRPDVSITEFNLAAASADIAVAQADLYPSLNLLGSIAANRLSIDGVNTQASTWSFGPSLNIPLFDGGKRAADVNASKARYDYALAGYRKAVREAVREIEDALQRLDAANRRLVLSRTALRQYQAVQQAVDERYGAGMAGKLDAEEAARTLLQGQDNLLASQRESVAAWIAVYKALGGGWNSASH